jgi:hypothetical protein
MPDFLVEFYMARVNGEEFAAAVQTAERAADDLAREGESVLCLHAIFVPKDETCFLLYRADSAAVVHKAVQPKLPLASIYPVETACRGLGVGGRPCVEPGAER